ncbi:MAG: response regulator [Candidatus Obscuribacter sp.]|nr:response regulator [Candidatus Obscuribacter sp.]
MHKVCYIEDDPDLRQDLAELLEISGLTVRAYESAEEFLTSGSEEEAPKDYSLWVVDLTLPGLNGRELCSMLRQRGVETPIVVLSGEEKTEELEQFVNLHRLIFISKPFKFDHFLARVLDILPQGAET